MTNIETLTEMTYNFRKITELNKSRAQLEALAKLEIDRIQKWLQEESKPLDSEIEFRQNNIIAYYKQNKTEDQKFKLSTPYGKVKSRKMPLKYEIKDPKAVIAQLRELELGYCIRVKTTEEIDKDALKTLKVIGGKLLDESTGAYIEGVEVIEQEDKITLEVE